MNAPLSPSATFSWVDEDRGRMACGNDIAYVGLGAGGDPSAFSAGLGAAPAIAHLAKNPPRVDDTVTLLSFGSSGGLGLTASARRSATRIVGVGAGTWGPKRIPIGEGEILIDDGACRDEAGAGLFTPSGAVLAVASRCVQGATIATIISDHASPTP
jgi:hypothetical protein